MRHGDPQGEVPADAFFGDDSALALVNADMGAYMEAHPCLADDETEEICMASDECNCNPGGSDDDG